MLHRLPANERRAQLVESAISVAEEGGIGAVTVRAVAENAGVSLGVVHYCFENKDALLAAMAEAIVLQISESMHQAFAEAAQAGDIDGVRGLRMLVHSGLSAMWPMMEKAPKRQMLAYELTSYSLREEREPSVGAEQYRIMDQEAILFLDECAKRTHTVWLEPLPAIARFSLALLNGLTLRWLVDHSSEALIAQIDDLAGIVASKAIDAPRT